jgi:Fe-S cluster biogenesis protein NfuA
MSHPGGNGQKSIPSSHQGGECPSVKFRGTSDISYEGACSACKSFVDRVDPLRTSAANATGRPATQVTSTQQHEGESK